MACLPPGAKTIVAPAGTSSPSSGFIPAIPAMLPEPVMLSWRSTRWASALSTWISRSELRPPVIVK